MKVPNFLIQDRHGGYQFRRKIPSDLRQHFSNKREIRRSLRTHHRGTAIRLARIWAVQTDKLFEELMQMAPSKKDRATVTAAPIITPEAPLPSGATPSVSGPVHVATFAETASISVKAALNALLKANAPIFLCPDSWPGYEVEDIWEIEREDDQFVYNSVELKGHRTHAQGFWQAEGSQSLLSSLIQREVARAQVLKRGLDHAFFLEFEGKEISANDLYANEAFLRTAEPLIAASIELMKANPVAATVIPATALPRSTIPKLSEIFDDFKTFKRGSKKAIRDTSLDEYETALEDLIFVCGDVPVRPPKTKTYYVESRFANTEL